MRTINFDMDGTIADLYGVDNWLDDLTNSNPRPYIKAKPLLNMQVFARILNKLKKSGYTINIISWLSKDSTAEYDMAVTKAKKDWLKKHLKSVEFDNIYILPYGTPKQSFSSGILFDDEKPNRKNWENRQTSNNIAYDVNNILDVLKRLI